jgi:hypothetical protein
MRWLRQPRRLTACAASLLLFAAMSASALEIQDVKWGFDGQAVPNRFNILSVLVGNFSSTPFDGSIEFYKSRGMARVGAVYRVPCYVSPLTTRWVQFYVYTDTSYDQWRMEWGRGPKDYHDFDPPRWGPPAQVMFTDSETALSIGTVFKQFPEELFPPGIAGTSGLNSVILDHAPRWEPAKRQAFLDWLQAGGKVHVLLGADGRYPVFSDQLSVLNLSSDRGRIGAGLAVRHAATAQQIHAQDVEEDNRSWKQYKENDPQAVSQSGDWFFRTLASMSRPQHSWDFIYLMATFYLFAIGPGIFYSSRKMANYRLRIGLLLGIVAVFAWLFNLVGRQGQGAASVVHTLSYARVIKDDKYAVTQWINLFATRGSQYTVQHASPHNIYNTGQDYESVNGWIEGGKDAKLVVDIPMFSRRALLHEAEMKGAQIPASILKWDGADQVKELSISVGPEFAKEVLEGWVVQGNEVYRMRPAGDHIEFNDQYKEPFDAFVKDFNPQTQVYEYNNNATKDDQTEFRNLARPLMAWALGAQNMEGSFGANPANANNVQLFLFARSPSGFGISKSQFGREVGYVLYQIDLFRPEK